MAASCGRREMSRAPRHIGLLRSPAVPCAPLAFVDVETTGLDPLLHEIWEVALVVEHRTYVWQLPVDLGRADARALALGRFHERRAEEPTPPGQFAAEFSRLTWDGPARGRLREL